MKNKDLKKLKDTLWNPADQFRANSGLKEHDALLAGHPKYTFTNIPLREMPDIIWT